MRNGTLLALGLAVACGGAAPSGGGATGSSTVGGSAGGGTADAGTGAGGAADGGVATAVVAIELSQTDVHIPVRLTTSLSVTATYPDGTRGDVTDQAQATSSNTAVATVAHVAGAQIVITAVASGTSNITVTFGSAQRICTVTVTPQ